MKESKIEKLFHLQLCRVMQVVIKQSLLHNYKDNQYCIISQLIITYSKSTKETLEKGLRYVQS